MKNNLKKSTILSVSFSPKISCWWNFSVWSLRGISLKTLTNLSILLIFINRSKEKTSMLSTITIRIVNRQKSRSLTRRSLQKYWKKSRKGSMLATRMPTKQFCLRDLPKLILNSTASRWTNLFARCWIKRPFTLSINMTQSCRLSLKFICLKTTILIFSLAGKK